MSGGQFREEQARLGSADETDDEVFEMANLPRTYTGVDGTIFISTAMGSHAPRVKWYPGKPGRDNPCLVVTLETPSRAINQGLAPHIARNGEGPVTVWVERNRAALLAFWKDGTGWDVDEVNAFIGRLEKLT